jgi:hypothetical protein
MAGELDNNVMPDSGEILGEEASQQFDAPDTGGSDQDTGSTEDYSFSRWQREKGYKDPDDLGKAYGHANKHITDLESENARFREYIQSSIPWIQYAEQKYAEESGKGKGGDTAPPKTENAQRVADSGGKDPADIRNMVKEVASELIGPQINKLTADVSRSNVRTILKTMREDKKNFPYMSKETEEEMNKVLQMTNRAFPVSEEGIRELYNAAVGRRLPTILNEFRSRVTDEISENLENRKNGFFESDRIGETGNVKNAHKNIVDSIVNASYGKSQI